MADPAASRHHVGAERIGAVDPLRGFAMVLVIAQHAYHFVDPAAASNLANQLVYVVTPLSTVAFVATSGMMLGFFLYSARSPGSARPPREVALRFRRRALFILVLAHPAIHLARLLNLDAPELGVAGQLAYRLTHEFLITDTIAVCLLIAPPLMLRTGPAGVATLATGLLAATLAVLVLWQPSSTPGRIVQALLFGSPADDAPVQVGWPLVPWLGIFLLGGLAGELLARARSGMEAIPSIVRRLVRAAAVLFALGVVLTGGYKLLRITATGALDERTFRVLYPDRTTGLLPFDLAVLAALLAWGLWHIDLRGRYDRALWALSVFGRTSLFTYVVQFVIVHSLPAALGLRHRLGLGGVLALAICAGVATWLLAYAYGRARGWITTDDYRVQRGLGPRLLGAPAADAASRASFS